MSLFCWLPLYVTVVLHLFSVHYPRELPEFIHWLIFIQSSISSLLPLCDASYRRALWAAHSVFKACARRQKNHVDLCNSRDLERKVEGTEKVQLKHLVTLDVERLGYESALQL